MKKILEKSGNFVRRNKWEPWSTEDTQQLYPNRLGFQWACACMQVCGLAS